MNKEEILLKAKKENKNGDEKQLSDRQSSYAIAGSFAALLCIALSFTEGEFFGRFNAPLWIVYCATEFVASLVGLIKSKHKWLLFPLITTGLCTIGFVFVYVKSII